MLFRLFSQMFFFYLLNLEPGSSKHCGKTVPILTLSETDLNVFFDQQVIQKAESIPAFLRLLMSVRSYVTVLSSVALFSTGRLLFYFYYTIK